MQKIKLLMAAALVLIVFASVAQTSNRTLRYQGFAIDPEGAPLKSEAVTVRFTMYPKTGAGFVFEEVQNLTTNPYGVFYAAVGEVEADDFQRANFTAPGADYWMKIEVKKTSGGIYTTISDEAMTAVPYARHADNGVPVGTIMSFGGQIDKIPEGWLLCDGSEYDGEDPQFEQLYEAIGNNWGGEATAFNVPDLTGIFVRGLDYEAGNDPEAEARVAIKTGGNTGDKVGSFQRDTIGVHTHYLTASANTAGSHSHSFSTVVSFYGNGWGDTNGKDGDANMVSGTNSAGSHSHDVTGDTDEGNTGLESRPMNAYVVYIIKY